MANAVLHRVWNHSQARGAARCLLLALADVADERGIAYPGIHHLASMINETPDYTGKLIDKLITAGELFKIAGKGRGHVTRFALLCGLPDAKKEHLKGVLQNPFSVAKKGHPTTPLAKRGTPIGVLQSEKRGTFSDTKQPSSEAAAPPEPPIAESLIHHDPHGGGGGDRARAKKVLEAAGLYPKTIEQILAMEIDPETLESSVRYLTSQNWGPGAIADRLRTAPPEKGHPYERPESRPIQPNDAADRRKPSERIGERPALPKGLKLYGSGRKAADSGD